MFSSLKQENGLQNKTKTLFFFFFFLANARIRETRKKVVLRAPMTVFNVFSLFRGGCSTQVWCGGRRSVAGAGSRGRACQ